MNRFAGFPVDLFEKFCKLIKHVFCEVFTMSLRTVTMPKKKKRAQRYAVLSPDEVSELIGKVEHAIGMLKRAEFDMREGGVESVKIDGIGYLHRAVDSLADFYQALSSGIASRKAEIDFEQ